MTKFYRDAFGIDTLGLCHAANHALHIVRYPRHIHIEAGGHESKFCGMPGLLHYPGHVNQALAWHAAKIQTIAAQLFFINKHDISAQGGGYTSRRQSARSPTDNRHVIASHRILPKKRSWHVF